jgi:hypothetical protein
LQELLKTTKSKNLICKIYNRMVSLIAGAKKKVPPIPWRAILTSVPVVWSLIIAQIGHDWGFVTLVTDLPLYMNDVLHFSIGEV